ncbi:MAG: hypothetical protein Q4P15_05640, partial [Propionibacteriaceae bacterium]|nr:hypothetical protein [Propionibacteriaceae bacterium]
TTATTTETATSTATATATKTVTATAEPTSPTVKPTAPVDEITVYTTPGFHKLNGRSWYTTCEPYSQTIRCTTDIWSTQVQLRGGKFLKETGWHFNNLTYLPEMTRAQWGLNPLANTGAFTSAGRQWRTECDTAVTGRGACRSYIWSKQVAATQLSNGSWSYAVVEDWVFNNIVRFRT